MNNLSIQKTDSTPEIDFNLNGNLKIMGRSLPEDVHKFYNPVIDWVKQLNVSKVKLDLKLEYLNTSSTKKILSILFLLEETASIKNVDVNWYYEFDDLDMAEVGQIYKDELKKIKFNLIEGADIF